MSTTNHTWVVTNTQLINKDGWIIGEVNDQGWYWMLGKPIFTKAGDQVPYGKLSSLWRPDDGQHFFKTLEEAPADALEVARGTGWL